MHDTKLVNSLNRSIVSLYKVLGFVILGLILGGLLSYLATHGFFRSTGAGWRRRSSLRATKGFSR
jgi:hypothetical protein